MHQVTNMHKNKVFHHSYMFRHVCDILRELVRDVVINIADIIQYILRTKCGVGNSWEWHRRAKTCRSGERSYFYICL